MEHITLDEDEGAPGGHASSPSFRRRHVLVNSAPGTTNAPSGTLTSATNRAECASLLPLPHCALPKPRP